MTSPSLRETQRWMKSRILPPARGVTAEGCVELNPQAGDPGIERLSIYSGGYLARVQEALEEAYPAIRHVLGSRAFSELSRAYAARHPSRDYNLSLSGRNLPVFLESSPWAADLPFLPDLARLEWSVTEAFHAFDLPPLDPARLASIPPEQWDRLKLIFQPSARLVASAWPVLDIWEARDQPVAGVRVDLINRPQRILVYRNNLQVRCELLEEASFLLLRDLSAGRTLGDACAGLTQASATEDPPLADWFSRWAAAGLIVNINLV